MHIFHGSGKTPADNDLLNRIQRILDIIKLHDLKNTGGIPSKPGEENKFKQFK